MQLFDFLTFGSFFGYRLPIEPSAVLSNRVLSRNHSGGSHCFLELKLCFSCLFSNSVGSTVYSAPCRLVGTVPTAFYRLVLVANTVAPESNVESMLEQEPCWCGKPSLPEQISILLTTR